MGLRITRVELDLTDRQRLHPHIRGPELGARSATASHALPLRNLLAITPPARVNSHAHPREPLDMEFAVVGQPACRRTQGVIWGQVRLEKNYLGGLTRRFSAWRAARLIPTGAGDLNGLAPAVLEAINRYAKTLAAVILDFGFRPVRAIGRGLHLPQQVSITIALRRVLGEWPWHIADLGEVRRAKIGRARFQA